MTLTPTQTRKRMLDDLARSGLTAADAKVLGMEPVTLKGLFDKAERYRIPYHDLDGKPNGFYRVRYVGDNPPIDKKKGKPRRYDQPPRSTGAVPRFYMPQLNVKWKAVAAEPKQKIAITEGEKKAAKACKEGIPTIGLGGIWNWSSDHKPIPDFELFVWAGREVEICCDYDPKETTRTNVQMAASRLAVELMRRGATVRIVYMPPGVDGGKQGLDDFLVEHGRKAFDALPREEVEVRIQEFNENHFVVFSGKTVVVAKLLHDDLTVHKPADIKIFYANQPPILVGTTYVPFVDYWLRHPLRRTYEKLVFEPEDDVPDEHYNLWRGFAVEPVKGDCSLYLDLLRNVICSGDKALFRWVQAWMADAVQHPGNRPGTAIAMRGGMGVGKGTAVVEFGKLFGRHFTHIFSNKSLVGNFNSDTKDALVLFADEAVWAGDRAGEGVLKGLVTEPTRRLEGKFVDAFSIRNNVRLLLASNKEWIVPAGFDERRFCVIDVSDIHKQDTAYFGAIVAQMENGGREALLHHLLNLDIADVDLRSIPQTAALTEQKIFSMTPLESWWLSKLREGSMIGARDNQKTGWYIFSAALHSEFIEEAQKQRQPYLPSLESFSIGMRKLVPGLKATQATFDGTRKRCWLLPSLAECRATFPGAKFDGAGDDWSWPKERKY